MEYIAERLKIADDSAISLHAIVTGMAMKSCCQASWIMKVVHARNYFFSDDLWDNEQLLLADVKFRYSHGFDPDLSWIIMALLCISHTL